MPGYCTTCGLPVVHDTRHGAGRCTPNPELVALLDEIDRRPLDLPAAKATWELKELEWDLAAAIYLGRVNEAWGGRTATRPRFPATEKERRAYSHSPTAEVDLALASAREVIRQGFVLDLHEP